VASTHLTRWSRRVAPFKPGFGLSGVELLMFVRSLEDLQF